MSKRTLLAFVICSLFSLNVQAEQFVQAPQYGTGNNPQVVAVGDFNGDGKMDIAVGNAASNTVSVLLGNGDGTYGTKVDYPTGTAPAGIAVGDVNGDSRADLVITNSGSSTVSVLLGNGDGTFKPKVDSPTGTNPHGITLGDFNKDGHLDIAETNATSTKGTVGILLGNGDGTFGAVAFFSTANNPFAIATGDVNNDGSLDLIVANNASPGGASVISVLLGNGKGSFQQFQNTTGSNPIGVVVADFNGDGFLDIATAGQTADTVSILLGNGTGSFSTISYTYPTADFPTSMTSGDFNGDGKVDLAVSAGNGNDVTVMYGAGDGTFPTRINVGTGNTPYFVAAGDLNNDGKVDLVAANEGSNTISVIMSNGNQTFQARTDYVAGFMPYSVASADFNGDGIPDLAMGDKSNEISVSFGNGDGSFQPPLTYPANLPYSLAVGDFNGDHIQDIAVANYGNGTVSILLGLAGGTFQPAVTYPVGKEPSSVVVGDFNKDGIPDLAVANFNGNTVGILLGNGDGTFKSAVDYPTGNGPVSVAAADFNGDHKLDLVVINETDNNASIFLGNGDGTFAAQVKYSTGVGGNPLSVVAGDFNGDGALDLGVADFQTQQVSVLLGNGDGTFQAVKAYATGANPSCIVAADFNGDGKLDLALTSTPLGSAPGNMVSLLLGNGDGTFGTYSLFGVGYLPYSLVVGDFNGDGTPDLAVANEGSDSVSVLLNSGGTLMSTMSSGTPSTYGQAVTFTTTISSSVPNGSSPTGSVTLNNGSTVLGSAPLAGGSAAITTSTLPLGTDSISAIYSGDSNYRAHTVVLSQTVQQGNTSVRLTSSLSTSTITQTVSFTAMVTTSANTGPTGAIQFMDGNTVLGSATLTSGSASMSTSSLMVGTHSITASSSGDANSTPGISSVLTQTVQKANAAIIINASPASADLNQKVTFTATVTPSVTLAPTGAVMFYDGANLLGSAAVNASGVASFSTSTLSMGVHSISASYNGDGNLNPITSSAMSLAVSVPDFSLSAAAFTPATIAAGASTSATLTMNLLNGMSASNVSLTCSISPAATPAATCLMGAVSVTNGAGTSTVTVQTVGAKASLDFPGAAPRSNRFLAFGFILPAVLLGGVGLRKGNSKKLLSFCLIFLALSVSLIGTSCGGGSSNSTPAPPPTVTPAGTPGTPSGTYSVTITGTSGSLTHTAAPVSFTVQ